MTHQLTLNLRTPEHNDRKHDEMAQDDKIGQDDERDTDDSDNVENDENDDNIE